MTSTPSKLDLTGQASEDEPPPAAALQLNRTLRTLAEHERKEGVRRREPSRSRPASDRRDGGNKGGASSSSSSSSSPSDDRLVDACPPPAGGPLLAPLLARVPCPLDLWRNRTLASLFLLPFVFVLYVALQLPLHHGSATEERARRGRAGEVDDMSSELDRVGRELGALRGDQREIKGMVTSLRRRLGKMRERRERREEMARRREERERAERERERRRGVAGEGPLATATLAQAVAVATFAGKPKVDEGKKDD